MLETSTSNQLHCYTTLRNYKTQNYHRTLLLPVQLIRVYVKLNKLTKVQIQNKAIVDISLRPRCCLIVNHFECTRY